MQDVKSAQIYTFEVKMNKAIQSGFSPAFGGWLADVPEALAHTIVALGDEVAFDAEDIIYQIGDSTRSLWCVVSGSVRMNIATNGNEHRFGHLIGPGFWFGEYELLTGQPRLIEMQAAEPSRLLRLHHHRLEALGASDPEFWRWIAILSTQHTLLALSAADDLLLKTSSIRMAALLLRLSGLRAAHPATAPLTVIPLGQQELSEALNMSRSSTGSILRDFERKGIIAIGYRSLRILNVEALQAAVLSSGDTWQI
jgi:CRP-like cAMP-binding protein